MSGIRDERLKTGRRTIVRALFAVVAVPPMLLVFSLFGLFPWSGLNCCQDDIDLTSGRIRFTRYLLWVPVRRIVNDSTLTTALSLGDRTGLEPEWHPVVTLSPGLRHSPHYRFHAAIDQIRHLEICWEFGKMTLAARRETASHVLRLWRQSGDDFRARDYIQAVLAQALEADKKGEVIDVSDLPLP
ncbi:hypothetical protein [Singulisphaera acidiphila]|uniref:Uncharacterized protein n=1 Tax=Singulisphaera acidiphila (strain ATCC BAA-1392 / DSM 18658 / VKM B-2454 / MOB10) TaxID=886293 RepID=L0DLS7_SINAD|nr:hypothetical protein [Singulisphaera acidiphila]AGA29626.1 hypothetical protein Sinac_5482 [Singulisphaera acidiphila DSM 18658]